MRLTAQNQSPSLPFALATRSSFRRKPRRRNLRRPLEQIRRRGACAGLSSVPDITSHEITADDKYLVMGSDGVFDVLTNRTIAKITGKMNAAAPKVCNELIKELRKRPGTDDVTLLVVQLHAAA